MTHEEKISYMRMAMGLANFGFSEEQLDLLVSMYDLILEKEEETDLDSMTTVVMDCRSREDARVEANIKKEIETKKRLNEIFGEKKKNEE